MSSEVAGGNTQSKRNRRGRGRRNKNNQKPNKNNVCYQNVTFHQRPSSNQPGSPQRYFDDSYDVVFNNRDDDDGTLLSVKGAETETETLGNSPSLETPQPVIAQDIDSDTISKPVCGNNQVVHRHLNGLCIVTAGNVLTQLLEEFKQNGKVNEEEEEEVAISSIHYFVKVGKDSQSAKGKMRTKNKRQKRSTRDENGEGGSKAETTHHDGNVSPHDPLCRITLSNGQEIQLNCCVAGTVIEMNQQFDSSGGLVECDEEKMSRDAIDKVKEGSDGRESGGGDLSLVLKDPLLDGYLAVIMPTWGAFPPKENK